MAGSGEASEPDWLIVDALNVIGSRPDGWWHDRAGAVRDLVVRLEGLAAASPGLSVTAVVDGRPSPTPPAGRVEVVYAGGDRDAADDRIIQLLEESGRPATVVTADRELRRRAEGRGARLTGPTSLLERLDRLEPDGGT